jgi:site-specific DNA recombinase
MAQMERFTTAGFPPRSKLTTSASENQKHTNEAFIESEGWRMAKMFVEPGGCASTTDRPMFQQMLSYCRDHRGEIKHVVVYTLCRFARNANDHLRTSTELAELGIRLHSSTQRLEDTPTGRLTETILAGFAQFDNEQRTERTNSGMRSALQAGRWPRGSPLGFLNSGRISPTLVEDPVRAPLIREAFEMVASGCQKPTEVLHSLHERGLRTKKGNTVSDTTFRELLRNELFTGWMIDRKHNLRVRGDFQPLISEELFARTQLVLDGRRPLVTGRLRGNPEFPLRGFLRCETCGFALTGSFSTGKSGSKHPYYHCLKCFVRFRRAELQQRFIDLLTSMRPNPDCLRLLHVIVRETWRAQEAAAGESRASLKRQIAESQARQSRLAKKWVDNKITEGVYGKMFEELEDEIRTLTLRNAELQSERLDIDETLVFSEVIITRAAEVWEGLALDGRQKLQFAIFPTGLTISDEKDRTPDTVLFSKGLRASDDQKGELVDQTGIEPVTS